MNDTGFHCAEEPACPAAPDGVLAFPASVAQQMFWYLELLEGNVTAFNVPLRFRLSGPLDPPLLERTLHAIIARHEALRTHFAEDDGELLQIVLPELTISLPVIDISHLPEESVRDETERLGTIEARRPFDLARCPLIRAGLLRISPVEHILHVTIHHALFDGMSMTVLTSEIASIYQAFSDGAPDPLPPLTLQYGDYSVWQKEFLAGPETHTHLEYWKAKLAGMREIDLPTDFPRPPVKSWKGEIISELLPVQLTRRLLEIAAPLGATLFHLQLAAYMVLLHRYTGETDIAVGTPVAGRARPELEPVIGVFINSLIIRADLSGNPSFLEVVRRVRDASLEALEHQDLPFEHLVRELKPARDPGRNPLFQVNFNHHRSFARPGAFGGVTLTPIPSRSPGTIFDLHFFMVERAEGWRASCDFSTDLFSRGSARRMLGHYIALLHGIAATPEKHLAGFPILTPEEMAAVTGPWAFAQREFPAEKSISALFTEIARKFPDRTALVSSDEETSYAELLRRASAIAHELITAGVNPGDFVAISTRPGVPMIAGFLGILLAGGCCVPLDFTFPAERFAFLLAESQTTAAVTDATGRAAFPAAWDGTFISAETLPASGATPPETPIAAGSPSHLLFTSGTTGNPKGVLIPHRAVVRLVRENDFISITADDVFLQAAPASFDASLLEIFGALLNGGKLVLLPGGPSLEGIAGAVQRYGVSILWLTSGLFQIMIDEHAESLRGLKFLLAGGDVLSPAHVERALSALPATKLVNGYGPTENTTFTTTHHITREDLQRPSIPIGKPIANTSVYILDATGNPVPVGIPGELFTGGSGLAIGYHNAPELTAEKFIVHPEFGRLYRTGDRTRWNSDGTIEFLGRKDNQAKVRGFRIEPGEIEAALAAHAKILAAKAAIRGADSGSKRIFAWAVSRSPENPATAAELATWLAQRLPAFMLPDAISVIPAFPLNANGKIDLKALPDPAISNSSGTPEKLAAEPPAGPVEQKIATLWQELLGVQIPGRHADFFALGGHSLMALRMFSRLHRETGISLPLATLIGNPTIAKLAEFFTEPETTTEIATPSENHAPTTNTAIPGNIVTLKPGGNSTPLICIHGGDGGVIFYRALGSLMPEDVPLHAIESLELSSSEKISELAIEDTARMYVRKLLELQPAGPFRLAGYSFGGVVALEMASQLAGAGHRIDFLGLFDTHNPAVPLRPYSSLERARVFWRMNDHLPLIPRIKKLHARFREGLATRRRILTEVREADIHGPAAAFSDMRRIQVREENWRAMQAYRPRRFDGRITLFCSAEKDDKYEYSADYGWQETARGGLEIVTVPGHHLSLFSDQNIGGLARALTNCMNSHPSPLGS